MNLVTKLKQKVQVLTYNFQSNEILMDDNDADE